MTPQSRSIQLPYGNAVAIVGDTYEQCAASLLRQRTQIDKTSFDIVSEEIEAWFAPPIDHAALEREATAGRVSGLWQGMAIMVGKELARHAEAGGHAVEVADMAKALANAPQDKWGAIALRKLTPLADKETKQRDPWLFALSPSSGGRVEFPITAATDAERLRSALSVLPQEPLRRAMAEGIEALAVSDDKPQMPKAAQWSEFGDGMWVNTHGRLEHKVRTLRRACAAVGWALESNY